MFSLFPRKSASVLLFRETVQTQYLNKRKKKVHKNSVVPSKHFSNPPNPQTFVSLFGRGPMDRTLTDRSFQDSPGKYLEESRPRNRSKTTWMSPRGASRRPDSNRRAWPQAPGAGGRGVPKTLVGLWLSLLFVDRSRAFACSLHRPDVRPTRVSATTSKRQQQREELQRKAARAQARESVAMYTPRGGVGVSADSGGASPQR